MTCYLEVAEYLVLLLLWLMPNKSEGFFLLSHKYIDECLKRFNFGQSIRRWVSLFFCNRVAYILLRGELTKKILLEQGVPQGDVVSPYIFILAVELLLIKIVSLAYLLLVSTKDQHDVQTPIRCRISMQSVQ